MYSTLPSFTLGFHGCDESVVNKMIRGRDCMRPSTNSYDWLGHGIYFWENDPERALAYATMLRDSPQRGKSIVTKPAVLGAVIDLGHCLNLMEAESLGLVRSAYGFLQDLVTTTDGDMPTNKPAPDGGNDLLLRHLDCAVIELCHEQNSERPFDTVRGLFFEGDDLYPNAGFKAKNHIQVCVRNHNCIKGFFLPRESDDRWPMP